jgi:transcriptional regulator with XRE-family HTH domain
MGSEYDAKTWGAALGRAIKVRRTDLGLERADLAERAGISYPYLSEIESGKKRPSDRTLRAIAHALEMRTHELVAEAEMRAESLGDEDAAYLMAEGPSLRPRSRWFAGSAEMRLAADDEVVARERTIPRSIEDVVIELRELVGRMTRDDVERVLDLARRLGR